MDASGRELRAALNDPSPSPKNNAAFYGILVSIAILAGVAVLAMTMMKPNNGVPFGKNDAGISALASNQVPATFNHISSDFGPEADAQNAKVTAELNAAIQNSPQGRLMMQRTKQMTESPRAQNVQRYHATVGKLSSCLFSMNNDARIRSIKAGYEKRNSAALESWTARDTNMMDRAAKGEISQIELGLWAANGGAGNAAMDNMMAFGSISSMGEKISSSECSKLASKVSRKELDILGRR